jgi:hypothetical protein
MMLSKFLDAVSRAHGVEALEGAMVFVMLKRPLDELISTALAVGPYHRGKPSPWSHCFLLAEPYRGPQTRILDCTIRDQAGRVLWHATLPETLRVVFESSVGQGAGAIYEASLGDYDDARVLAQGVKWFPGLDADDRRKLVAAARTLKADNVKYDLPGLLREAVRLLTNVEIPSAHNRLFSSAFLQAVYRAALGNVGDFAPKLADADTTPDDIWYSHKGLAIAAQDDALPQPKAQASLFGAGAPAITSDALGVVPLESMLAPPTARREVERALAKLKAEPRARQFEDYERVVDTLENAVSQLNRVAASGTFGQSTAVIHSDDYELSLVLSSLAAPREPTELGVLFGRDIPGFHQYEDFDAGWLATLWRRITSTKVPFPPAPANPLDLVYPMPDETSIAIAGDWGTGNASSLSIAREVRRLEPDYTIHLGDVYYSGTETEVRKRLLEPWPAGRRGSLALNSNHEMYSGGHGYFGVALASKTFRLQRGYSYFALTNRTWLVIGLDSAYGGSFMYANGVLNDHQMKWLRALMKSDAARSGADHKNVIVLTHHQGIELDGGRKELFHQVTAALGNGPHRWYWGHVHGAAAFKPIGLNGAQLRARLCGHGGVPYAVDPLTPALAWTETERAGDAEIPKRALNGFALLRFTRDGLEETFYDERGRVRWREP